MVAQQIVPIVKTPLGAGGDSVIRLSEHAALGGTSTRLHPHEHLYFQGDTPKGVYEIEHGTIILYRLTADGRRQIQDFASDGDFLALTFADEHDLSAEALTNVKVRFIPRAVFDRALQTDAEFRRGVFTLMADVLHSAREQSMLLGLKSAMERTASFLLFLDGRFRKRGDTYTPIRMSRCDIADYLGLTLETVSRMLNRLKHETVIDLPRPDIFRIRDHARLIALSGDAEDNGFHRSEAV